MDKVLTLTKQYLRCDKDEISFGKGGVRYPNKGLWKVD